MQRIASNLYSFEDIQHVMKGGTLIAAKNAFCHQNFESHFNPSVDFARTLEDLSLFFERIVQAKFYELCSHYQLDPLHGGCALMALGKLGSREVNLDSDLDLMFLRLGSVSFNEERVWELLLQDLIAYFATQTPQGHLPNLDFDLRPYGASSRLTTSVEAAQKFYWNSSDLWNRLAWLRGRFLCGDVRVEEQLHVWLPQYVFPKYLDYRMLEQLQSLHAKIAHVKTHTHEEAWALKFGMGGIREIEFLVQGHILIHGGRRPEGRSGNTFEGINYLKKHGIFSEDVCQQLLEAIRNLRILEHTAQMVEGRKTVELKKNLLSDERVQRAFKYMGFNNAEKCDSFFNHNHALFVKHFQMVQADPILEPELDEEWNQLLAPYRNETQNQKWTLEAREQWKRFQPLLISMIQKEFDGSAAILKYFLNWVDALKVKGGYFRLLLQHPPLLKKLITLLKMRTTLNLDSILSHPRWMENSLLSSWDGITSFRDYWNEWNKNSQYDLEALRECRTTFLVEILHKQVAQPEKWLQWQQSWNEVCDVVLQAVAHACVQEMPSLHTSQVEIHWIVLGSHGGRHADIHSDLDCMILVKTGAESHMAEINRFCQKAIRQLTSKTPYGELYPVDMRLRPSGSSGPLVVGVDYFLKYAADQARLWEWLSWFRGRESFHIVFSAVPQVQPGTFYQSVLAQLETMRATGVKQFQKEDIELFLKTLQEHRKSEPHSLKWAEHGLIESEARARVKSWRLNAKPVESLRKLCSEVFNKTQVQHIEQLLEKMWTFHGDLLWCRENGSHAFPISLESEMSVLYEDADS